jgi:isoleucyl-tRNA synthetase
MLGNLFDFDPAADALAYASLEEIDRFALHKLQRLVQKSLKAYKDYEFHTIYHALHNFCTLDLSAFYLDILKDRLYTSPPRSSERRSAQTVLHILLDCLARLMAPILPFTADEIWQHMPAVPDKPWNIHLALLPEVNPGFIDADLSERWEQLLQVRAEVMKALEEARAQKLIGHPLDAAVTISAPAQLHQLLSSYGDDLRSMMIVSKVTLVEAEPLMGAFESDDIKSLYIRVEAAAAQKCERCWVRADSVGDNPEHPQICYRCVDALERMG